jgi:hypothetical protein
MNQIQDEHLPEENQAQDILYTAIDETSLTPGEISRLANPSQNKKPFADITEKYLIQEEARMLLHQSPYPELWSATCEFHEGVLTLRGEVPSFFLKQVAQSIVFGIERVKSIDNHLDVVAYPESSDIPGRQVHTQTS